MNNSPKKHRPHIILRFMLLALLCIFLTLENNPLVRLEAIIGLSPSPIERFFGIKSLFSGMTESINQVANLNLRQSIEANIFGLPFLIISVFFITTWKFPKLDTRVKEAMFFLLFLTMSAIVNIVHS